MATAAEEANECLTTPIKLPLGQQSRTVTSRSVECYSAAKQKYRVIVVLECTGIAFLSDVRRSFGTLFHAVEPVTAKARFPTASAAECYINDILQ